MLLTDLLSPDRIKIPLSSGSKDELLRELVQIVGDTSNVEDLPDVLRAVREREGVLSTGIGHGVAIPHGKSANLTEITLVAGVTPSPIDFEALDGRPVRLFFLLVGPDSAASQHVKALSRISRLLRRDTTRARLVEAATPEDFYSILADAELP
ncbi:MAG TPA: PTS sugar transporter subunit IIA [Longimicrobiaceae bacterium]|nr:PTS sugar transporter subunit IIA [Longimicrobiaceae bacterium]